MPGAFTRLLRHQKWRITHARRPHHACGLLARWGTFSAAVRQRLTTGCWRLAWALARGEAGVLVGMIQSRVTMTPLAEVAGLQKPIEPELFMLAKVLEQ